MKYASILITLVALHGLSTFAQGSKSEPARIVSSYLAVHSYDPARNASEDILNAIKEAQRSGKRVLVEIGGDWCPWCHSLAQFFDEHVDVQQLRDEKFVTVYVYYGTDQKNERALSRYSKVVGIPHFFVLDGDGKEVYSQHVIELESDGKYDPVKMRSFLEKWSTTDAK